MAIQVSNAFVTLFDAEVKQAYQGESALRNTVRLRTGVEAATHKFPKIGKGVATVRVPQTDVTPLNVTYAQVTCTLSDYIAAEYSDIFNQAKINFDERQELVQVVSKSIARRQDQMIIDALTNSSTSLTVASSVGGANTNLNLDKLLAAKKALDAKNVPPTDRFVVIHANNLASLLDETEVKSSDFNTVKALVAGQLDTYLGFKFITIGDRDEGGLAIASGDRKVYAFHKQAVGMAEGMGLTTRIDYIAEKTSYLVASMFSAGAVAIDAEGIVEITCDENGA